MGGGLAEHKSDVPRRSGRCPSAVNGGSERADVAPPLSSAKCDVPWVLKKLAVRGKIRMLFGNVVDLVKSCKVSSSVHMYQELEQSCRAASIVTCSTDSSQSK